MKSVVNEVSSFVTKKEAGKSSIKVGDMRQALKILKDQHVRSCYGNPSVLLKLYREARRERTAYLKKKKKKKL